MTRGPSLRQSITKRAGGSGLILDEKAFSNLLKEGVELITPRFSRAFTLEKRNQEASIQIKMGRYGNKNH